METKSEKRKIDSLYIGVNFLICGIALFVVSVLSGSMIISVIGLGLTFWGALLLLIPPPKHVEASFLITSVLPDYMTIDRMLNYLNPTTEAYNIPPCPKDINLPKHLEGLKQMVTFIPMEAAGGMPEIEDIARGEFLTKRPKGLLIASPGTGLLDRIEQKGKTDFTKIPAGELDEKLSVFLSELYLAKNIELTQNETGVVLKIDGSLYSELYTEKYHLKSINLLGCPLVNAAACAIAKSIGKPIMVQEIKVTSNGKTISANLQTVTKPFKSYQRLIEANEKTVFRKEDLLKVINASIEIVDLSFDILIGLRNKRIDWQLLEGYSKELGDTFSFSGQSMPFLNLSFLEILSAVNNRNPNEISKETFLILTAISKYFDALNLDDDVKDISPNYLLAKAIIMSYYELNDLLLGKVVNDKVDKREQRQLEGTIQILVNGTDFNINLEAFMSNIEKMIPENDLQSFIEGNREIFKEQFKLITR
jgi:hypothetical protein